MEGDHIGLVCKDFFGYHWRGILTLLLPIVLLPLPILGKSTEYRCGYVILVMAVYWAAENIPPYITSLIPIVAFPLLGVLGSDVVCKQYMRDSIFLFLGGVIIALSVEFSNLHKRLAFRVILIFGCRPRSLHCGIMILTMLISMCVNNVATTMMMCPVVNVVLTELAAQGLSALFIPEKDNELRDADTEVIKNPTNAAIGYYLGVAYAATLGGTMTLTGTITNLMYKDIYERLFPAAKDTIYNHTVLAYTAPIIIVEMFCFYFFLQVVYLGMFRKDATPEGINYAEASAAVTTRVKQKLQEMGRLSVHEWQVAILCILLIGLLFTRDPGWTDLAEKGLIYNSWPLVFVLLALFVIPKDYKFCRYCFGSAPFPTKTTPSLISWKFVHTNVPWGLMLLIGSAYSLVEAIEETKLAEKLAHELRGAAEWPLISLQCVCVLITVATTIFCPNVAVCSVLVSFFAELARVCAVHPFNLILPAGVACSAAFLLPTSTPSNAVAAAPASVRAKHMIIAGIVPTVIAILMLFILCAVWHSLIFPASKTFPDWAKVKPKP